MYGCNVEELVRRHVIFKHGTAGDWNKVFCEVCGDGSRRKGPRGGWLFSDGGDTAFYHCFNCGCNENFSVNREHPFSKGMRDVFDGFGIPRIDYNALLLQKQNGKVVPKEKRNVQYSYIELPDYFSPIEECDSKLAKDAKMFLRHNYALTPKDFSFYVSTGLTKSKDNKSKADAKRMAGRLVIPFFRYGKIIYFQARDILGKSTHKYISPNIQKHNILFNVDELDRISESPLYVVEGAMDAIHLNGVATLGNELSTFQCKMLQESKRRKILVPDFNGDSDKLCQQFIRNGWEISLPEYRTRVNDVSQAILTFGKLYVAHDIANTIKSADEANILVSYLNLK